MTVYIGVDFHARQQTISYLTTEDGEIKRLQLDHGQPVEVRRFYQQFTGQRVVVGSILDWGQAFDSAILSTRSDGLKLQNRRIEGLTPLSQPT